MSVPDRIQDHLEEHRSGMLYDFMFAVVWVAIVTMLFEFVFVDASTHVYYLFLLLGIPAYFAFFWSLEVARDLEESDDDSDDTEED